MKARIWVAIAMLAVSALAGVLLATPSRSAHSVQAARGTVTRTFTTTASPTATGTPAVTLTPVFTATATSTPTSTATLTVRVYLPYLNKMATPIPTPTPTITPTPTVTPTPMPAQFAGMTDQDMPVALDVKADFSAVVRFRITITVVCSDKTFAYSGQISAPEGWPITDRRFTIRLFVGQSDADVPVYDVYSGEFDSDFSTAQGTWLKWGVLDRPICHNTGTWSASRQP